MDTTLLRIESYTTDANSVKETVLNRLLEDKIITESQYEEYCEKWQVIIIKEGWFKTWLKKFTQNDGSSYIFKYVKFED
jgi:hypothetical protein